MYGGRPETRYVEVRGGNIAYQVFGEGDRDILFRTTGLTNIDVLWDEPSAARFLDRLGTLGRVIHHDLRGAGVSDPVSGTWMTIEDSVEDLRAVLDAAGSERAVVYGDAEGGYFAMMLAASHPERVSALVLVNSLARLARADDYPIGAPHEVMDVLGEQYVEQHGTTGAIVEMTAPSVASDQRFRTWWSRYQRLSVPLGLVRTTADWLSGLDVRAALPLIRVPTLVVSRRHARFHRLAYSEFLADHIAGAELRVVEGEDTLPFHAGDFGPILDEVEEFLTGRLEGPRSDRMLSTVLFTDIVGSTERAAAMGDERWLDVLANHDAIVRVQLGRFRGQEIRMTGDGCLAVFDGPARAVACAVSIRDELDRIGVDIRAGIHTGEVEFRGGELGGIAVHIAARVMDKAEVGVVLVSGTVKDLVVGSGHEFDPIGAFSLKGVPGEWALFSVRG